MNLWQGPNIFMSLEEHKLLIVLLNCHNQNKHTFRKSIKQWPLLTTVNHQSHKTKSLLLLKVWSWHIWSTYLYQRHDILGIFQVFTLLLSCQSFNSHEWLKKLVLTISVQYQYNIKQTVDENKVKNTSGD